MPKKRFPKKCLVSVVPPGMEASKAIMTYADQRYKLNVEIIEECLLPGVQLDPSRNGAVAFQRPAEYAPPAGWVAPDKRPKNKVSNLPLRVSTLGGLPQKKPAPPCQSQDEAGLISREKGWGP